MLGNWTDGGGCMFISLSSRGGRQGQLHGRARTARRPRVNRIIHRHARNTRRGGLPPPHIRDHLAPGRRQDDADGEAASLRRRDPARRRGQGEEEPHSLALGLDEHRTRARHLRRHLGDDLRIWRPRLQPARHARPRGLRRRHLPHADGGRRGGDGDRRRQGHRAAHAEALRSLPPARHPDHHLRQQDGPRKPGSVRNPRRGGGEAGARHRPDDLADRTGADLLGHLPSGAERGARHRRRQGRRSG